MINAYAAKEPGGKLEKFQYDPGELGSHDVEIDVESCGICHSDLSMLDNEWGMTEYPFVPGHEVVGTISQIGEHVTSLRWDSVSVQAGIQATAIVVEPAKKAIITCVPMLR